MKYLLLQSLLILAIPHRSLAILSFADHKTETGILKKEFLEEIHSGSGIEFFIETGTYEGGTTQTAAQVFKEVFTSELDERIFNQTKQSLSHIPNIHCYQGESYNNLATILPTIKAPAVFWLDAHYCGIGTGYGAVQVPLEQELQELKKFSFIATSIIMIDDIRYCSTASDQSEYKVGKNNYPSFQFLYDQLKQLNPHFEVGLIGDILISFDPNTYSRISISETVKILTKNRYMPCLTQFTPQEQKIIKQIPTVEREFIRWLVQDQSLIGNTIQFQHDFWKTIISDQ